MIHLSRTCHRMMLIVVLLSGSLLLLQGQTITLAIPICNHTIEGMTKHNVATQNIRDGTKHKKG